MKACQIAILNSRTLQVWNLKSSSQLGAPFVPYVEQEIKFQVQEFKVGSKLFTQSSRFGSSKMTQFKVTIPKVRCQGKSCLEQQTRHDKQNYDWVFICLGSLSLSLVNILTKNFSWMHHIGPVKATLEVDVNHVKFEISTLKHLTQIEI